MRLLSSLVATLLLAAGAHAGGLRVAVLLKEESDCVPIDFDAIGFNDVVDEAIKAGLKAELLSGAPLDGNFLYPADQFEADINAGLELIESDGLEWMMRQGSDGFDKEEEDEEVEEDEGAVRRQRELQKTGGDPFCTFMCQTTGRKYYCDCACTGCRRRRQLLEEEENTNLRGNDESGRVLQKRVRDKKGRAKKLASKYRTMNNLLRRFRQVYKRKLWEYNVGSQVAEEYIKRQMDTLPCLQDPLEVKVVLAISMED
jgi:hypothetical protein